MISAKVIADSVSKDAPRLTTIEYVAPRFILAEFNTHRVFSRNAGSSRAIPTTRIIERVIESPVIPIWSRNKAGMQGEFDLTDEEIAELNQIWLEARDDAVRHAKRLADKKSHKQTVNRILEPYMYYKGLVSSTDWDNWFNLRDHEAAQPEIAILARAMRDAMDQSKPQILQEGEWHLPYVFGEEHQLDLSLQQKISVARCARLSYKTFDDEKISTVEKDTGLFTQLLLEKHLSPFEHQASPDLLYIHEPWSPNYWAAPFLHGNYTGWRQYRKYIELQDI